MSLRPGDLDLSDPDVFVSHGGPPHEYLAMLRREAPVSWNPAPTARAGMTPVKQGFWVLSKHEDVHAVSRNPKLFSSFEGGPFVWDMDEQAMAGQRLMLLVMDPPQHVKYRRLVQRGFTPRMVEKLEPTIRKHARAAMDRVVRKGECEFVEELACELPLTLICELMGIPAEDRRQIFEWSNALIGGDDPDMRVENQMAVAAQMWMYSNKLAAEKKAKPDDTLISAYVNGSVEGEAITEAEFNNFFLLLAVAGNETTRNATSQFVRLMLEHPDQWALLKSDVDRYLPGAIEEALRFAPPVLHFRRTAMEDTQIRGQRIRKGEKVYLSYPSVNRDEDVFGPTSMRLDITREKNDHLAFGIGEHFCLGANFARMQLSCILREIATRMPDLALVGQPAFQRSSLIAGIKRMPVRFTPEA
jgi:cholest-4-en-3-one 26-monooxygenase